MDCIFCRILDGRSQASIIYQDDEMAALRDIAPQAPLHVLIIPRRHIPTVGDLTPEDAELVGRMVLRAARIAQEEGVADSGYRLVLNCNHDGGQSVYHLHLHLLAGRRFHWPPG